MTNSDILCCVYLAGKFPPVDIAFALSATGLSKEKIFKLMKDTLKSVADKYGTGSLRYSFIVFSNTSNLIVRFSEKYSTIDELKASVEALPSATGGVSFLEVIESAKEAFRDSGVRKGATHVLVILTDGTSGEDEVEIGEKAVYLEESEIIVIPVGVGDEVDSNELGVLTSKEENVILIDEDEQPKRLMELIIARVLGMTLKNFVSILNYYLAPLMLLCVGLSALDSGSRLSGLRLDRITVLCS